jgi:outer membrane lipase/esterase
MASISGRHCALLLTLALTSVLAGRVHAQSPYSKLYVFGDSLTDSGNALFFTTQVVPSAPDIPAPPYVQGRFSNGYNFADDLSLRLFRQPLQPSLEGGTNFAVGGATTGTANVVAPVASGLLVQKDTFLSGLGSSGADSHALYLVYGGSNDLLAAVDDFAHHPTDAAAIEASAVANAMTNLGKIIGDLSGRGATHFLVPNLADLGELPRFVGKGALSSFASGASERFNAALALLLTGFPGLDIHTLDVHAAFEAGRSGAFGFSDTTTACYAGSIEGGTPPQPCADPDSHVFWDGIHPTARTHAILGDLAYAAAVPEPRMWAFLLAGMLLGWVGVRRAPVSSFAPSADAKCRWDCGLPGRLARASRSRA